MDETNKRVKQPNEIYCKNCGCLISKNAVICPNCGVQVNELNISPNNIKKDHVSNVDLSKTSGMSIASLVLGIVSIAFSIIPFSLFLWLIIPMGIVAIVLGIIDLVKIKNKESSPLGKSKNIAGIVLGAIAPLVNLVWSILFIIIMVSTSIESTL